MFCHSDVAPTLAQCFLAAMLVHLRGKGGVAMTWYSRDFHCILCEYNGNSIVFAHGKMEITATPRHGYTSHQYSTLQYEQYNILSYISHLVLHVKKLSLQVDNDNALWTALWLMILISNYKVMLNFNCLVFLVLFGDVRPTTLAQRWPNVFGKHRWANVGPSFVISSVGPTLGQRL